MSACRDPRCPCANHGTVDVAALPAHGIRLEWFGAKWRVAAVATCLLPPGSVVTRYELARRLAGCDQRAVRESDQNVVRTNVLRLRHVLVPHGWDVRSSVSGHVSLERAG